MKTAQRVSSVDASDNYVLARSILAYRRAAGMVGGRVLEIGTGSGYGVEIISPAAASFVTVDKHTPSLDTPDNVEFRRMRVPPLDFPSCSFDYVISFQVIEHIRDDFAFLDEVYRVLKPGGRFIVTTPHAPASLTRNPWHMREYDAWTFTSLMESRFERVEALGVFGGEPVMEYYRRNRENVARITRFDPLRLQYRLPRWMLKVPYDILNRLNRRRLVHAGTDITPDDYHIAPVADGAFDLFYVGTKL